MVHFLSKSRMEWKGGAHFETLLLRYVQGVSNSPRGFLTPAFPGSQGKVLNTCSSQIFPHALDTQLQFIVRFSPTLLSRNTWQNLLMFVFPKTSMKVLVHFIFIPFHMFHILQKWASLSNYFSKLKSYL